MSSTNRQNRLLLTEDWERVYQSYRNAEFKSYDFDTIRRTLINYLRQNYPEDFNDYIESSEYLALIDMIAFLGQNIAFRIDLNARDNFLELSERRESILRLARLLSYNARRNQAANGILKIDTVTTTENIIDSNNLNLSGQTVTWNDPSNVNWYEQFIKVLNSALPVNEKFGKPTKKDVIDGIPTNTYRFNSIGLEVPVFNYSKNVDGRNADFEIVSTTTENSSIIEEPPLAGRAVSMIHRDDGKGSGSNNTGFFMHFRQGVMDVGNFNVTTPSSNQAINIDATNINDTDVWLYSTDTLGNETALWTKLSATEGNNVVYNSTVKSIKNIYSAITKTDDRVTLQFSDGTFGNLPQGTFKVYYRTSDNRAFRIVPDDMQNVEIDIDYVSENGKSEVLTLALSLKYTVDNATSSEENSSIRANAPSTYYTQNRMITGEDYNISPLAVNQEILKVKSVNRVSSGVSRYFDLIDSTGKYSNTNLYGNDGIIYKEELDDLGTFTFTTRTDIEGNLINTIEPGLSTKRVYNFYTDKFPKILLTDINPVWTQVSKATNQSTGNLQDANSTKYQVGTYTASQLKYIEAGALCKFEAPTGYHFMSDGTLMAGASDHAGASTYKWTGVVSVSTDGTTDLADGSGAIKFNDIIPSTAILTQIIPKFNKYLSTDVKTQIIDQIFAYKTFGLRYDLSTRKWKLVDENNLNLFGAFNTGKTGDTSNAQLDASWLLKFTNNGETYTMTSRGMRYVFESDREIRFFYDSADRNFDYKSGKILQDRISVLSINTAPDVITPMNNEVAFDITKEYRNTDGYVDSKKIELTHYDSDQDGIVDNPTAFDDIVASSVNPSTKYIFQKKYTSNNIEEWRYINATTELIFVKQNNSSIGAYSTYTDDSIIYLIDDNAFKIVNGTNNTLTDTTNYKVHVGRDKLKFQYVHTVDGNTRLDASSTNIMDLYMVTKTFDTNFRQWLNGTITTKPLPPSSDALYTSYSTQLNSIKSISDEIIYHTVKYKILFGSQAETDLQASFKIVKNAEEVTNDSDIKSRVLTAIGEFFSLDNWDFGETFYFSELSTYVMNELAPDISTFIIVPNESTQSFGSLYEVKSENDEIFVSGATLDNIEIIDAVTAAKIKASGKVVSTTSSTSTGVTSNTTGTSTGSGY